MKICAITSNITNEITKDEGKTRELKMMGERSELKNVSVVPQRIMNI
jgi:hypothetical protein